MLSGIQLMQQRVPARVSDALPETMPARLTGARLDHILESGVLQVGLAVGGYAVATFLDRVKPVVSSSVGMCPWAMRPTRVESWRSMVR